MQILRPVHVHVNIQMYHAPSSLGLVNSLYEAALYVFVFMWTPSLERRAARAGMPDGNPNPLQQRLSPYAAEAATLCSRGCHPM